MAAIPTGQVRRLGNDPARAIVPPPRPRSKRVGNSASLHLTPGILGTGLRWNGGERKFLRNPAQRVCLAVQGQRFKAFSGGLIKKGNFGKEVSLSASQALYHKAFIDYPKR